MGRGITYLFTSHVKISATKGKFGVLKLCMETRRGKPKALIISVKPTTEGSSSNT